MPFGLKKSDKDGDLDSKKSSLFSSRSKAPKPASPAPSSSNPYAVPPAGNDRYTAKTSSPYAATQNAGRNDPYLNGSISEPAASRTSTLTLESQASGPPGYTPGGYGQNAPNRYAKSPVPSGGYGGPPSKYQNTGNSYGQTSGYGSDPYGNGDSQQQSRYGPSGYGGLGRNQSQETVSTEAGRNLLFGNAAQRVADKPQQDYDQPNQDPSYSNSGGYASNDLPGGYGSGPMRELTAEEQEEQDISATKDLIRSTKQDTLASSQRSKRIAMDTLGTLNSTLTRLGVQSEMIHNTEKNLDMASKHNRLAVEQANELDKLTNSMFRPAGESRKKQAIKDNIALTQHQLEREQRDTTQKFMYESQARQQRHQRELDGRGLPNAKDKARLAERSKYQFEATESDDEIEQQLEDDQHDLHNLAKQLNLGSQAIGEEIRTQNQHLDRLSKKADKVDDGIAVNTRKLEYILKK